MSARAVVCLGLLTALLACGDGADVDPSPEQEPDDGAATLQPDSGAVGVLGDAGSPAAADAGRVADAGPRDSGSATHDSGAQPLPTWVPDEDGDGFRADVDCYDHNKLAYPGQTGRFQVDRGDGSFDYDCDGEATGLNTRVAECPDVSKWTCPPLPYRDASDKCDYNAQVAPFRAVDDDWTWAVPACGTAGQFGLDLEWHNDTKAYVCMKTIPAPGGVLMGQHIQTCN